jgi:hypothetical protein
MKQFKRLSLSVCTRNECEYPIAVELAVSYSANVRSLFVRRAALLNRRNSALDVSLGSVMVHMGPSL